MGVSSNGPIPDPPNTSPLTPKQGVEKPPFRIAAKWLEIDENVNRAQLIKHSLALSLCAEQCTTCAVVEWPDHHCGDDLVLNPNKCNASNQCRCIGLNKANIHQDLCEIQRLLEAHHLTDLSLILWLKLNWPTDSQYVGLVERRRPGLGT